MCPRYSKVRGGLLGAEQVTSKPQKCWWHVRVAFSWARKGLAGPLNQMRHLALGRQVAAAQGM